VTKELKKSVEDGVKKVVKKNQKKEERKGVKVLKMEDVKKDSGEEIEKW
jgi:hypothetical protein